MKSSTDREALNMGLDVKLKNLTCSSCTLHCKIMPEKSPRLQYCANACFCMWPEESIYFNKGVIEGILNNNHNARLSGYIFVDFSISFLRLFLDKEWIEYLASTRMGIILISDRNMQSLANYWRKSILRFLPSFTMMTDWMSPMRRSGRCLSGDICRLPKAIR